MFPVGKTPGDVARPGGPDGQVVEDGKQQAPQPPASEAGGSSSAAPRPDAPTDAAAPAAGEAGKEAAGPPPAGSTVGLRFLDEAAARQILGKLKGVDSVTVRVIGPHEFAGPEVIEFIRASGFLVSYQRIDRIVPAPTRRYTLQYRGRAATITVAPDQDII